MGTIPIVAVWRSLQGMNGVQSVMMLGKSMMLVLHVGNLVSHMELVKLLHSLVVELDKFGLIILAAMQQAVTFSTAQIMVLEITTVIIQKMLVQFAFQSVSLEYVLHFSS